MNRKQGIHDEMTKVAYELYEKRDGARGHDVEDWLEAEKIVAKKHERHAKETGHGVDVIEKPTEGFRRTVKKEGFYKKG